jgi:septal ring factor EnvC (AmiA/AmiB activator)
MFRVPNSDEGRAFVATMRKYALSGTRIRARGRGARKKHAVALGRYANAFQASIPLQYASAMALYVTRKNVENIESETWKTVSERAWKFPETQRRLELANREIDRLESDRVELMKQRDALQQQLENMRQSRNKLRDEMDAQRIEFERRTPVAQNVTISHYHIHIDGKAN